MWSRAVVVVEWLSPNHTTPHRTLTNNKTTGRYKIFLTKDGKRGLPNEVAMANGNYSSVREVYPSNQTRSPTTTTQSPPTDQRRVRCTVLHTCKLIGRLCIAHTHRQTTLGAVIFRLYSTDPLADTKNPALKVWGYKEPPTISLKSSGCVCDFCGGVCGSGCGGSRYTC